MAFILRWKYGLRPNSSCCSLNCVGLNVKWVFSIGNEGIGSSCHRLMSWKRGYSVHLVTEHNNTCSVVYSSVVYCSPAEPLNSAGALSLSIYLSIHLPLPFFCFVLLSDLLFLSVSPFVLFPSCLALFILITFFPHSQDINQCVHTDTLLILYCSWLLRYLVNLGCIKPLCDLLTVMDSKIVQVALNGLENILRLGDQEAKQSGSGNNPYCGFIEEAYGMPTHTHTHTHTHTRSEQVCCD